jgi:hypothetical protein
MRHCWPQLSTPLACRSIHSCLSLVAAPAAVAGAAAPRAIAHGALDFEANLLARECRRTLLIVCGKTDRGVRNGWPAWGLRMNQDRQAQGEGSAGGND